MNTITLMKLAVLATLSESDLVKTFVEMHRVGSVAYLNASKALIALTDKLGSEAKAVALLKKSEVKDSTIKNALRHVAVYNAVVRPGFRKEEWFDDVLFTDAVAINAAIAKVGSAKKLNDWGVFKLAMPSLRVECEMIAETGKNKADRLAAQVEKEAAERAAAKAAKGGKSGSAKGGAATPGESSTPETPAPAGEPAAAKPPVNPVAEFDTAAEKLEAITMALLAKADEVMRERIRSRVEAINNAVIAAIAAKTRKGQKTA